MARRIKLPVGRHGHGEVGKAPLVAKKNARSAEKERKRTEAYQNRLRFARQADMLKRERPRTDWDAKFKYVDARRPPGVGHLANDPVLLAASVKPVEGGYFGETWATDPFACGAKPVLVEDTDWTRRKVMVNKSSFPTVYLPWITCQHCLVLIDAGMTSGYLELNELKEAVDPRPDDVERKKVRQRWRRLLRARREPEQEG